MNIYNKTKQNIIGILDIKLRRIQKHYYLSVNLANEQLK